MLNAGKRNVVGILMDAVDYEEALRVIFQAARENRGLAISALAVHGVMTGVLDREHKWQCRGTFQGGRARQQEYQAARARRRGESPDTADAIDHGRRPRDQNHGPRRSAVDGLAPPAR